MSPKSVVLPAPLGPMMARRSPASTSRLTASTARSPPNAFDTLDNLNATRDSLIGMACRGRVGRPACGNPRRSSAGFARAILPGGGVGGGQRGPLRRNAALRGQQYLDGGEFRSYTGCLRNSSGLYVQNCETLG